MFPVTGARRTPTAHTGVPLQRRNAVQSLAGPFDRLPETPEGGRGSRKEVGGKRPVTDDVAIDPVAVVAVDAQTREILQPQIAVAIDGGCGGPAAQVARAAGVIGEEIVGAVDAD